MDPTASIPDPAAVLASEIVFVLDQEDLGWFVGRLDGSNVYLRLGNFPEENMYSLWLGNGKWLELEELPANWQIDDSEVDLWPESARPRKPKEYYT